MFQEPRGMVEEDSHRCTLGSTCIHMPVHPHTVTSTCNTFHLYMPVFLQMNEGACGVTQPEPYLANQKEESLELEGLTFGVGFHSQGEP